VRLYWSHLGTSRVRASQLMGKPPLRSMEDIPALVEEVRDLGFTAFKTNILFPGESGSVYMPGVVGSFSAAGQYPPDLNVTSELVRHLAKQMESFRRAAGPEMDIALDLNFNFKTEGYLTIARALEPYGLMWIEIDTYDPKALLQIKQATATPICSAENLFTLRGYIPFFELRALDVAMIDVPWNGFTASKKIADLADAYEINVAPHNYYSHLATMMSAHLCAVASNVRIMEIDVDDVPWRDDLVTEPPRIEAGHLLMPSKPGWGLDLNEAEIAKHPWLW
jgi:galactonate dehydratase